MGDEGRSMGHLPTSQLQPGVSGDLLSTCLKESSEPQCKSHKPTCWREKTPSASLALWLYISPHCPSRGVSPRVLTLWWGFGSCCDSLTLCMQMSKSWLWPWVTPVAFALPAARAGSSCRPSTLPRATPSMEQLSSRTFRQQSQSSLWVTASSTRSLETLLSILASLALLSFMYMGQLASRAEGKD